MGLTLAVGFLMRWWSCKPECRITVIALPLVALFAPFSAFASYGVVERCALSFAFLLTALVDVRTSTPHLQRVGALALAIVFLFRIATVTADWRAAKPSIQAYRATFASLKSGSVLFQYKQDTTYPSPRTAPHRWNPYLDKVVALATLDRVRAGSLSEGGPAASALSRRKRRIEEFQDVSRTATRHSGRTTVCCARGPRTCKTGSRTLQTQFTEVYLAVFDPQRRLSETLTGWQLVATLPEHRLYRMLPR